MSKISVNSDELMGIVDKIQKAGEILCGIMDYLDFIGFEDIVESSGEIEFKLNQSISRIERIIADAQYEREALPHEH
jgi:hypothetical protein